MRLRLKADGRIVERNDGRRRRWCPTCQSAPKATCRYANCGTAGPDPKRICSPARAPRRYRAQLGAGQARPARGRPGALSLIARAPQLAFPALKTGAFRPVRKPACHFSRHAHKAAAGRADPDHEIVEAQGASIPCDRAWHLGVLGRTCARIVEQALRLGYRHLDTAQGYENEGEVAEGLRNSGVPRSEVFVTTKVWTGHFAPHDLLRRQGEPHQDAPSGGRSPAASLAERARAAADTIGALAQAKPGLTRHIGVSNFTVALMEQAVGRCPEPLVCNQVEYHPDLDQSKVIAACKRHGLAPVAYSPIARAAAKATRSLAPIGGKHGKSSAQVACAGWCSRTSSRSRVPRGVERLSENIEVFDFELSDDEMAEVAALASPGGRLTDFGFSPKWD